MRRPIRKQRDESDVKAASDRLCNLAVSAQGRIDLAKDELAGILTEITSEKEKLKSATESRKQAEELSSRSIASLDELRNELFAKSAEKRVLEEALEKRKTDADTLDSAALARLAAKEAEARKRLDGLVSDGKEMEKTLLAVEESTVKARDGLASALKRLEETELRILSEESSVNAANAVLVSVESDILAAGRRLSELQGASRELEPAEKRLLAVETRIADVFANTLEAEARLDARKREYQAFEERTEARLEAARKLEAAVENKTRRLKAVQDEKGIAEYLAEFGIK